jgi:hypothetical protein
MNPDPFAGTFSDGNYEKWVRSMDEVNGTVEGGVLRLV